MRTDGPFSRAMRLGLARDRIALARLRIGLNIVHVETADSKMLRVGSASLERVRRSRRPRTSSPARSRSFAALRMWPAQPVELLAELLGPSTWRSQHVTWRIALVSTDARLLERVADRRSPRADADVRRVLEEREAEARLAHGPSHTKRFRGIFLANLSINLSDSSELHLYSHGYRLDTLGGRTCFCGPFDPGVRASNGAGVGEGEVVVLKGVTGVGLRGVETAAVLAGSLATCSSLQRPEGCHVELRDPPGKREHAVAGVNA